MLRSLLPEIFLAGLASFQLQTAESDLPLCLLHTHRNQEAVEELLKSQGEKEILAGLDRLGFKRYEEGNYSALVDPFAFGRQQLLSEIEALKKLSAAAPAEDSLFQLSDFSEETRTQLWDGFYKAADAGSVMSLEGKKDLKLRPAAIVNLTVEYEGQRHTIQMNLREPFMDPEKLDAVVEGDVKDGAKMLEEHRSSLTDNQGKRETFLFNPRKGALVTELQRAEWTSQLAAILLDETRELELLRQAEEEKYIAALASHEWAKKLGLDRLSDQEGKLPEELQNMMDQQRKVGVFNRYFGRAAATDEAFWSKRRIVSASAQPAVATTFVHADSLKQDRGNKSYRSQSIYMPLGG